MGSKSTTLKDFGIGAVSVGSAMILSEMIIPHQPILKVLSYILIVAGLAMIAANKYYEGQLFKTCDLIALSVAVLILIMYFMARRTVEKTSSYSTAFRVISALALAGASYVVAFACPKS